MPAAAAVKTAEMWVVPAAAAGLPEQTLRSRRANPSLSRLVGMESPEVRVHRQLVPVVVVVVSPVFFAHLSRRRTRCSSVVLVVVVVVATIMPVLLAVLPVPAEERME